MVLVASSAPADEDPQAQQEQSNRIDQPLISVPNEHNLVKLFLSDEVQIWTSPFRPGSYSGKAFPKYVVPFTLITAALVATDHQTANILPNTTLQATWSRRVSQIGAPYSLVGIAGVMYFVGRSTGDRKAREVGFLGAEAVAHSLIVTEVLKLATQRERPLDFETNHSGGLGFGRSGGSFPSGHASGSFALATVFAYEYGREHRWVPYVSYGLASVVAASRLSAQQHWLSDVFVGGTMGFMIGRFVYKHHHDPRIDGLAPRKIDQIVPQISVTAHGGTAAWNW